MLPGDSILTLETWNSKPETSSGACFTTNRHESCGRTAERFAEVCDRLDIQSRVLEGFVAGFCQLRETSKLTQQTSAFDLADADDLVQL